MLRISGVRSKKQMWPGKPTGGTLANGSKEVVGPTTLAVRVQNQVLGVEMGDLHSWMLLHEPISGLSWRGDSRGTNTRLSGHRSVTGCRSGRRGGGSLNQRSYGSPPFELLLGRDPDIHALGAWCPAGLLTDSGNRTTKVPPVENRKGHQFAVRPRAFPPDPRCVQSLHFSFALSECYRSVRMPCLCGDCRVPGM